MPLCTYYYGTWHVVVPSRQRAVLPRPHPPSRLSCSHRAARLCFCFSDRLQAAWAWKTCPASWLSAGDTERWLTLRRCFSCSHRECVYCQKFRRPRCPPVVTEPGCTLSATAPLSWKALCVRSSTTSRFFVGSRQITVGEKAFSDPKPDHRSFSPHDFKNSVCF